VLGTIKYPFFTSPGTVYGLTSQLHIPSKVIGVAQSSEANPGEFLYFNVLTVRSAGVVELAAFPETLEILTETVSIFGICSLVI